MLQIVDIRKEYRTGELVQKALDGVSLALRDCEFVSILGPSGSGKTTLLNIIGGLDRYDSGDLIINGTSTKEYKERDWDTYRNHSIGFIFQSYNLIPHQTILANVELALTIAGLSPAERKARAAKALEDVGLGDQLHKKPNQMSGGQMQRVAIARALVNDPEILLADEPTGALDTETSIQVMELLKKVASDRLVVMVTHNPELANEYSSRIVRLRDGRVIDDTNPFVPDEETAGAAVHNAPARRARMSFGTSLALSFNNLLTKKGRTILTGLAGSIGIIGIALILSLSTGANRYIEQIQKDTMTSYPITINAKSFDMASMMMGNAETFQNFANEPGTQAENTLSVDFADLHISNNISSSIKENNLSDFKKYLDDPNSEIQQYIGENGVMYSYNINFKV
ncbi:MAG: ABC transporter ATP-binding protein, partial [Lachnospiraceae bacterium]|nr:ABC transporter ATP-binding protein [Lachnospiraceae bacterium]